MAVHVANNSGNNEWYTPDYLLDSARVVLGSFDVDPASNPIAQQRVRASAYFTKYDSGLDKHWVGKVWMNPPYSAVLIKQFAAKLTHEMSCGNTTEFVVLVNNATETAWFREMCSTASAVCLLQKRVKFLDPDGKPGAPLQGQCVIYGGDNPIAFANEFRKYGIVCKLVTK